LYALTGKIRYRAFNASWQAVRLAGYEDLKGKKRSINLCKLREPLSAGEALETPGKNLDMMWLFRGSFAAPFFQTSTSRLSL
jgi:hypothetical protein